MTAKTVTIVKPGPWSKLLMEATALSAAPAPASGAAAETAATAAAIWQQNMATSGKAHG